MATAPLLTFDNLSLFYGTDILLDKAELKIFQGERICLIAVWRWKIHSSKNYFRRYDPDRGDLWSKPGLKIARLEQELPFKLEGLTVFQWVAEGLAELGQLLADFHHLTHQLDQHPTEENLTTLSHLQQQLDAREGWRYEQLIKTILQRLELPEDKLLNELSGGWQRRAALARALVCEPDLLLLDEPTNHLDIEAIQWMEEELSKFSGSLLFITHDRALLQRLATRIIELDRGTLTSWPGDYANFLRRKEEMLAAESKANEEFDKKLASEEKWIRQGIKARRTRNEGRVRALKQLRFERTQRREQQGKAVLKIDDHNKSGELVIEAKNIHHSYGDKIIIKNFQPEFYEATASV